MRIKLQEGATMPKQSTKNAAGYDLYAMRDDTIYAGCFKKVPIGVHMEIPIGIVGTISHRSGMNSKQGIQAYGRVDADYRGEVSITLFNGDGRALEIKKGDRIAQVVFVKIWSPSLEEAEELSETKRSSGGHGSTGR